MTDAEIQEIRKKYSDPNYMNLAVEHFADKLASAIVRNNILDSVKESLLKQRREFISEEVEADLKVLNYREFHKKYKDITMNRMYNLGYKIKHGKYYLP